MRLSVSNLSSDVGYAFLRVISGGLARWPLTGVVAAWYF